MHCSVVLTATVEDSTEKSQSCVVLRIFQSMFTRVISLNPQDNLSIFASHLAT